MTRDDAKRLAIGMESGITWRRFGIRHRTGNELLIDIVESLEGIVDHRGTIINAEISGVVRLLFSLALLLLLLINNLCPMIEFTLRFV